ncbi:hypothetical protein SNE40_001209 [Patella caerulea]|uniref:G-protein coupled receptors family 1 profile domain-containing protein n=1 Tax=Patella caerulea TaxID=87958 RepID=A0AAN8KMA8_PATCE
MLRPYESPSLEIQLALSLVGILGNLCVVIALSKRATNWSTFIIYLRCLALFDTIFLLCFIVQWAVKDVVQDAKCQFVAWTQTFPLACSIWLAVALVFDRLLRRKKPVTGKRSGKMAVLIALCIVAVCGIVIFFSSCSVIKHEHKVFTETGMSSSALEEKTRLSDMIHASKVMKKCLFRKLYLARNGHKKVKHRVKRRSFKHPRFRDKIHPTMSNYPAYNGNDTYPNSSPTYYNYGTHYYSYDTYPGNTKVPINITGTKTVTMIKLLNLLLSHGTDSEPPWLHVLNILKQMDKTEIDNVKERLHYLKQFAFMDSSDIDQDISGAFAKGVDVIDNFLKGESSSLWRETHSHYYGHKKRGHSRFHSRSEKNYDEDDSKYTNSLLDEFFALGWLETDTITNVVTRCTLNGIVPASIVLIGTGIELCYGCCRKKDNASKRKINRADNVQKPARIVLPSSGNCRTTHPPTPTKLVPLAKSVSQPVLSKKPLCRLAIGTCSVQAKTSQFVPPPEYSEEPPPFTPNPEYCIYPLQPSNEENKQFTDSPQAAQNTDCRVYPRLPPSQENRPDMYSPTLEPCQEIEPTIFSTKFTPSQEHKLATVTHPSNAIQNRRVRIIVQPKKQAGDTQEGINYHKSLWVAVRLTCMFHGLVVLLNACGDLTELVVFHSTVQSPPKILIALNYLSQAIWWSHGLVVSSTFFIFSIVSPFFRSQFVDLCRCYNGGNRI